MLLMVVELKYGVATKMAWAKNGTPNTLTGGADDCDITDLTANKFNIILVHKLQTGGTGQIAQT